VADREPWNGITLSGNCFLRKSCAGAIIKSKELNL
jgi:hypothetical protein